ATTPRSAAACGSPLPRRLPLRPRRPRILGPRVLRIPTLQLLADLRIGVRPEAREVVGHLLRTAVRREEVQQHLDAAARDARRVAPAEDLLDADGEDRRAVLLVRQ